MVKMRQPGRRGRIAALAAAAVVLAAASHADAAATLDASVDHDVVHAGDTVRLTLRYRGDEEPQRPDLRPLASDFEILGTENSQSVTVRNGRAEATRELGIVLSPKHSGAITIPALQAGDVSTEPLRLTVLDTATRRAAQGSPAGNAAQARSGDDADLFVEASVDQSKPFVQGEVHYTVHIYDGVGIHEGALTEPTAPGVRIEPVGDTRTSEEVVHGRRYVVHERDYTLFPQTAGEITVPPVVLEARVPDEPQRGRGGRRSAIDDMFGDDDMAAEMLAQMRAGGFGSSLIDRMMSPGREVRVRSNPVTLSVQGRPADASSGWFLPASNVQLTQSWQPSAPTFRIGEAVRRTITLHADGASAQQLPKLEIADVDGVKQYAGQVEQRTIPQPDGVAAELVQTFDVLPSRAGTFTLPQIDVAWWDVAVKTQRTATLPAQTIEVLAAPGSATAQAPAAAPAAVQPAKAAASGGVQHAPSAQAATGSAATDRGDAPAGDAGGAQAPLATLLAHPLAAAGGGLCLILFAAAGWWGARRFRRAPALATSDASRTAARVPARGLVDALHQACTANDARAVRDALLAWGRATWSDTPPANVDAIARRLAHPGLAQTVKQLDDSLYAPRAAGFDGAALWRAFSAARKDASGDPGSPPELLPSLYPTSRMA